MNTEAQSHSDITTNKNRRNIFISLLILAVIAFVVLFELIGATPISKPGESEDGLTESQAQMIAEVSCIKGGEVLGRGMYNEGTRTWWFDANLNATQEGCNPACVVSEETKTAEINWRCTGAVVPREKPKTEPEPVACTMEAKLCPDGSAVGRTGPNCEFAPCPPEKEKNIPETVSLDKTIIQQGISITPRSVVEDSRCPTDVECVWAGKVSILAELQTEDEIQEVTLTEKEQFLFQDVYIILEDVYPLPSSTKEISPEEYIFKIRTVPRAEFETMKGIGE